MKNLNIEHAFIGDAKVFKNHVDYPEVTKRLAEFTLKGIEGKYRFWAFYNPDLKEWRPQSLSPVHVNTICSICEDKDLEYEKGKLCDGIEIKDLEKIWVEMKQDDRIRLKLLYI